MCCLEDEEAQKNGLVCVYYSIDLHSVEPLYLDLIRRIRILNDSLPYRNVAIHYCYNNPTIRPAMHLLQLVAGKENRVRFRTHFGKFFPCLDALLFRHCSLLAVFVNVVPL
jgi:hypothetical protein